MGLRRGERNIGDPLEMETEHLEFDSLIDQAADARRELLFVGEKGKQHADRQPAL